LQRVIETEVRYRGTTYTERDLKDLRALLAANRAKSRYFLSRELGRLRNCTQANGSPRTGMRKGRKVAARAISLAGKDRVVALALSLTK
jgi:hypothetical protein